MDLDISMRSSDCPYTVQFYGALFREGDVWICMEVMDMSLDKFYTKVYKHNRSIPEDILGKIAFAVVSALHYLYSRLRVIHRDVKPSNILINKKGEVKICDFGISGYLVDSVAKTIDAGCKPYMAVIKTITVYLFYKITVYDKVEFFSITARKDRSFRKSLSV